MNNLHAWRTKFGINAGVAAAVLGISDSLFGRIECGEVDPAPDLAMRILIVTGGEVTLSQWPTVRLQLVDGALKLRPIVAKQIDGTWGVGLFMGAELVARLSPADALELGHQFYQAAGLAAAPPAPLPVQPMEPVD